ncbi:MAG: hypothetical protein V4568_15095, partial [Pseudomonadota bacterium]
AGWDSHPLENRAFPRRTREFRLRNCELEWGERPHNPREIGLSANHSAQRWGKPISSGRGK